MAEKKLYKEYFQIDPKYFPQVTEALIKEGKVNWKNYFANDSFIAVLKQACDMVNGLSPLSMFTWGPYGSGKSHLLLTLISMLKAKDEEITDYFTDQNLSNDLLNKFIAMKNSGKIITIHRIGSSDITTETDLVLAVQQSVMAALDENGIDNQGSASMKDSFLEYISKPINRTYFDSLIKEDDYAWEFPEMSVDDVERIITGDNAKQSEEMLRKVMTVMKNIGQYGILKDTNAMSDWIKDIIEKNNIKAIIFAWDDLKKIADENLDAARAELIKRMCNYQGYAGCELILVFDAYKVKGKHREVEKYCNINLVFTKESETADSYIERVTHELSKEHRVRVATSDGTEQMIILGNGAMRISAAEFRKRCDAAEAAIREYIENMK